jgi:hypothetical protein
VKETIKNLEERMEKAMQIQDNIKLLELSENYLSSEEIQITIKHSEAKIAEAKTLQKSIEELKQDFDYMTTEEFEKLSQSLITIKSDIGLDKL